MRTFYLRKENQKDLLKELLEKSITKNIVINTDKTLKFENFKHISVINPITFDMNAFLEENNNICIDLFDIDNKSLKKINFGNSKLIYTEEEKHDTRRFLMEFIRHFSNIDLIIEQKNGYITFSEINLLGSIIDILMCLKDNITLNDIKNEFKNEFREDIEDIIIEQGHKNVNLIDYEKDIFEKVKKNIYDCLNHFINEELYNMDLYKSFLFWKLNNEIKRNYLFDSRFIFIDYEKMSLSNLGCTDLRIPFIMFKDIINIDIISSAYIGITKSIEEKDFFSNFQVLDKDTTKNIGLYNYVEQLFERMYELDTIENVDTKEKTTTSGEIKIRIPKQLHAQIKNSAKENGVSMNQYLLYLLTTAYYLNKK